MSKGIIKEKLTPEGFYRIENILDVDVTDEINRLNKIAEEIKKRIQELQDFIDNCIVLDESDPEEEADPEKDDDSGDPPKDEDDGDPPAPEPDPEPPPEPEPEGTIGIGGNVKGRI